METPGKHTKKQKHMNVTRNDDTRRCRATPSQAKNVHGTSRNDAYYTDSVAVWCFCGLCLQMLKLMPQYQPSGTLCMPKQATAVPCMQATELGKCWLVYPKAGHSARLRAGHRAEAVIDMQILSSCPGAPQGCQKVDGLSFAKKRRLYIITCVLGWPVLDSRSFLEIQPREVKIVYYSHLHAYSIFLPWFAPRV